MVWQVRAPVLFLFGPGQLLQELVHVFFRCLSVLIKRRRDIGYFRLLNR